MLCSGPGRYRLRGLHDRLRGGDGTTGVDPVLTKPLALPGSPVTSPLAAETDGWPILHAVVIRDIMYSPTRRFQVIVRSGDCERSSFNGTPQVHVYEIGGSCPESPSCGVLL